MDVVAWIRLRWRVATGLLAFAVAVGAVVPVSGAERAGDLPDDRPVVITEDVPPPKRSQKRGSDDIAPPVNRDPILLKTAPAEYPKELAGSGAEGEVIVSLLVDRLGRASHVRVENSADAAFTAAALEALGQYEFLPALKSGRLTNAPLRLIIPVNEDVGDRALVDYKGGRIELLASTTASAVDSPVRRLFGPRPVYPIEMLVAGKSGEIIVEFYVAEDGRARGIKVVESTYVEFSHAVEGALALWKFSAAQADGRPVTTGLRYRVSFQGDEIAEDTRAMARRLLAGENSDYVPAREISRQPKAILQVEPVAPPRASVEDRDTVRRANVAFIVDTKGNVLLPRVLSASDPVAGYTALAAVNYWTFEPAVRKKVPVQVMVTMPFKF